MSINYELYRRILAEINYQLQDSLSDKAQMSLAACIVEKMKPKKETVTRTEIENAVGDTSDEYTEGVVELFESKGFEVVRN